MDRRRYYEGQRKGRELYSADEWSAGRNIIVRWLEGRSEELSGWQQGNEVCMYLACSAGWMATGHRGAFSTGGENRLFSPGTYSDTFLRVSSSLETPSARGRMENL
ncbi:unnamed protein product [Pleuronectes platessa]|uniref:Uncharacterized protein n=1 Tax=Pleuronectes platessa TaxID=8262 RepID=A0A9N7VIM6_PLEPL|nr:unnamed protein product [Pleuronectes platessa]